VNKAAFIGFRGRDHPPLDPPLPWGCWHIHGSL